MEHWANFGTAVVALLAAVLGLGQYWRSRREKQEVIGRAFAEVLRGLGSESPVERVASAALTRRFFDPKSEFGLRGLPYASHAVRVISAVLRSEPTGPTQKLLADGLREAPSLAYADLQRANLQNCYWGAARDAPPVDATGADFFGADLSAASLRRAILRRAKFRNAVLRDTVLEDADCTEAHFRGADLCDASFSGAELFGAKFEDSRHVPPIIDSRPDRRRLHKQRADSPTSRRPQNQPSATRVFISAPSSLTAADNSALQQVVLGVSQAGAEVVRHLPPITG